jgi:hypothetical protein
MLKSGAVLALLKHSQSGAASKNRRDILLEWFVEDHQYLKQLL